MSEDARSHASSFDIAVWVLTFLRLWQFQTRPCSPRPLRTARFEMKRLNRLLTTFGLVVYFQAHSAEATENDGPIAEGGSPQKQSAYSNVPVGQKSAPNLGILSGKPTQYLTAPIVRIVFESPDIPEGYYCTGTILSNRHILTAAHCLAKPGNQEPKKSSCTAAETKRVKR